MHKECSVCIKWLFQVASEFIPPIGLPFCSSERNQQKTTKLGCFLSWLSGLFSFQQAVSRGERPTGRSVGCIWVRRVTGGAEICTWISLFYSIFRMCLLRVKTQIRLVTQILKSWPGTLAERGAFNTH